MYTTRSTRPVMTAACYSLIITGAFDDLDGLAKLIVSNVNPGPGLVHLIEYPVGWRLQVTGDNDYPDHAHDLVEQRIREGVPVEIANGKQAMATFVYTASTSVAKTSPDEMEDYPF